MCILSSASFATLQKVRNTIHFSRTLSTLVENKATNFEHAKKCTSINTDSDPKEVW